jgi:hypothetical protein
VIKYGDNYDEPVKGYAVVDDDGNFYLASAYFDDVESLKDADSAAYENDEDRIILSRDKLDDVHDLRFGNYLFSRPSTPSERASAAAPPITPKPAPEPVPTQPKPAPKVDKKPKAKRTPVVKERGDILTPGKSLTGSADDDERLMKYRQSVKDGTRRPMSARQEQSIEHLESMAKADPSKWNIGAGVGWKVEPRKGGQINRGFQVIDIDPDTKMALIRSVADTGLTTTGGNNDRIGDKWVHVADLVRDNKYNKPAPTNFAERRPALLARMRSLSRRYRG